MGWCWSFEHEEKWKWIETNEHDKVEKDGGKLGTDKNRHYLP